MLPCHKTHANAAAHHHAGTSMCALPAVTPPAPSSGRGYNTEAERTEARQAGIRVLGLEQCCELLKWGMVMGVSAPALVSPCHLSCGRPCHGRRMFAHQGNSELLVPAQL